MYHRAGPALLSSYVSVTVASQVSVAVGVVKLGVAGHSIVLGPGSVEITGLVVSATLIVWLAVLRVAAVVRRRPGPHMHHRAGPAAAVLIRQRHVRVAIVGGRRRREARRSRTLNRARSRQSRESSAW